MVQYPANEHCCGSCVCQVGKYGPELLRLDRVDVLSDKVFKQRVYGRLVATARDSKCARPVPGQLLGQEGGNRMMEGFVFPERNTGDLVGVVLDLDSTPRGLLTLEVRLEEIKEIAADLESKLLKVVAFVHA
jgi:hypothetical protein